MLHSSVFAISCIMLQIVVHVQSCNFDGIVYPTLNVPKTSLSYGSGRSKRDVARYRPLRIHMHLEEPKTAFIKEIEEVLSTVTAKVSKILHVLRVEGPLLLERTSCSSIWSQGVNKGRCSSIRSKPSEEFCENKIDSFQIPEQHLGKLDIYNFSGDIPIYSMPAGTGVRDADYILYVKSKFTVACQKGDIQAYASYCRLDQFGRPVAGVINFCPSSFNNKSFYMNHYVNVAFHEIFHALGFSKDLFPMFTGCPIGFENCDIRKNAVYEDVHNIPRLNLPTVIKMMKIHFNCSLEDFGGPLEVVNGSYTSHWDPLLLFSSIMSPSLEEPEYTSIDPITLSVFADSGWYAVNYGEESYSYLWGREEGCDFGFHPKCESKQNMLCNIRDPSPGCDFMHYTKTVCQQLSPIHTCGLYKPDIKNDCRKKVIEIAGQHLHHLRCFSVEKYGHPDVMCASYQCEEAVFPKLQQTAYILLDNTWLRCPTNESQTSLATVKKESTTVFCPKSDTLCSGQDHRHVDYTPAYSSRANVLVYELFQCVFVLQLLFYLQTYLKQCLL